MHTLEALIEPLRHSPQLPQAVGLLQRQIEEEQHLRQRFYDEMTPEQKVEFIDGRVVLHSPARNRHLDVTLWVASLLRAYVDSNQLGEVKTEKCLCVFPRNDYESDVVFFGRGKAAAFLPGTVRFPVPDLVVEVLSESTEDRDRGVKFEDFAANGVGEYWILDADEGVVEQYVLRSGAYELALKSSSGKLRSEVIAGFETEVEAFFDKQKNLQMLRAMIAPAPQS